MQVQIELNEHIPANDNIDIIVDAEAEQCIDEICLDTGYQETTLDIEINHILIDGFLFTESDLKTCYGDKVAKSIMDDIHQAIADEFYEVPAFPTRRIK